jgi:predicted HAD superfamily Cof-like phosphohydrolase
MTLPADFVPTFTQRHLTCPSATVLLRIPMPEHRMTAKPYRPQHDIVTLMKQFEQEVKDSPELPEAATRLLRARLVFEEALEFVRACGCTVSMSSSSQAEPSTIIDTIAVQLDPTGTPDLVEYVDGCIDQLVVTYGALNAAGIQAQSAWDEVQRSNMSKAWSHCNVCDAVLERGASSDLVHPGDSYAHGGSWQTVLKVHKREDGKFIKAPTYSPANLKRVIEEQLEASHESAVLS